jgi:hypothetical protein
MADIDALIESYMAVWNETDADERRRRICDVWAEDGSTCYRLLDAQGYEAIEARVTGSAEKWLREGKYIFRRKQVACHHQVIRFDFELVTVPDHKVEANGLCFLLLDADGRIKHDYQFNPSATDASGLKERYVAVWNEADAERRGWRVAELWAPDGSCISETATWQGHAGIAAAAMQVFDTHVAKGFKFSAEKFQAHHHVARLGWQLRAGDNGALSVAGSDLLILDDEGRVRCDYHFAETV